MVASGGRNAEGDVGGWGTERGEGKTGTKKVGGKEIAPFSQ